MKRQHWQFHWLTRWNEIWDPAFVKQWQSWLENSPTTHVFFHPALVRAWVDTYLPLRNIQPFFLIAESTAQTVFLPLVLWKRDWKNAFQNLLIPAGYSDYDYQDPIVTGADGNVVQTMVMFWTQLTDSLQKKSGPIRFDRFALNGIRQSKGGGGENKGWQREQSCPWIDLKPFENKEHFLPSLKMNLRKDLRRQQKRMNETGQLQHIVFSDEMEKEALNELEPFLTAHSRQWPGAYKAPFFYENLVKRSLKQSLLHFSMLKMGSETVAWHMGFVFQGHLYAYILSYPKQYSRFSPGKAILLKCIEDAIGKRFLAFDFLRGEESYKAGWADKTEQLWSLRLNRNRLTANIRNRLVDRIKPGLQEIIDHLSADK